MIDYLLVLLCYARVYCEHDGEYNYSVDCELDTHREQMPAIVINDPQFTTPYPTFSSDTEVRLNSSTLATLRIC